MMATLEQLESALRAADAAGNETDARILAKEIVRMRGEVQGQPEQKPAVTMPVHDPASRIGPFEAAIIGAGRSATRIGQGVQQIKNWLTGNEQAAAELKSRVEEESRLYGPLAKKYPIATGIGESLPAMAVPIGSPASLLGMAVRTGLATALPGALEYGSPEERAKRAVVGGLGGALGGAAGYGVGKLLQPVRNAAGVSDDAVNAAKRIGYPVTAGDITQNPALMNFENRLARSPGSAATMKGIADAKQTALNKAAARAIGENADNVGEGVLASARNRIGGEFTSLQQKTAPQLGDDFINALTVIDSENVARGPFASSEISRLVDKGLDLASQGKLSGNAYKTIHTTLAREGTKAFRAGDSTLGQAYKTIRESLDDAAKASLTDADKAAWDTVRKQWSAFKVLTKGNVAEAGNVSAARAASAVRTKFPGFRYGEMTGDIADIARVGEAFKSVTNPNSGNLVQQMLYNNLVTGVPLAIADKATASIYQKPIVQQYLTKGLMDMTPGRSAALNAALRPAGLLGAEWYLGSQ